MLLVYITIALFIIYSGLILYYWQAWNSIPVFTVPPSFPETRMSVIIPARNEEKNIGRLVAALREQTYPQTLFEIIVIDDHSTDSTADLVQQFDRVKLVRLTETGINAYKKKAIEAGITEATGDWIVTTDADCVPPRNWLRTLAAFREENDPVFIAAPVVIEGKFSLLQAFQAIDFMVLQGITGAVVNKKKLSMCNGANLAYARKTFFEVNGFAGIDTIASGDDMLLMHKIWEKHPNRVQYLKSKEAIMSTGAESTWKDFLNQRIRWASKARKYEDKRFLPVLLLVYFFNLSFLALLIAGFFCADYWFYLGGFWAAKTITELPFVYSVSRFFGKKSLLKYFFFFQPLHIFYTIVSGLFGQFGRYEWKGRRVT